MVAEHNDLLVSVEFQMSLLLFMALGGYLMASRIGQPAVVGVIVAGILIGPSVLGVIHFSDFIASIGHIGAIILLFAIGLESRISIAMKPSCFMIALGGVLLPWVGGFAVGAAFGFGFTSAIITGVALTATSLAITADTLRELGKMQSKAAQAIIGAAVIDDVLAFLALAISMQLTNGTMDAMAILVYIVKAMIFLVVGAWLGRKVLAPLISRLDSGYLSRKYPDFIFIMAMQISFFYAMVAELVGLSAIIGAFLAGISLATVRQEQSMDLKEGTEFMRIIFGAIFFISIGVMADMQGFTLAMSGLVAALTIVAILSKVIGSGVMAKLSGKSTHSSLIIGVGMSPRGETAMAIALIAFIDELIPQQVFVALVLTSLLTTIAAPLMLRNWLYKSNIQAKFTLLASG